MLRVRFRLIFILLVLILLVASVLVALLSYWPAIAGPRVPEPEGGSRPEDDRVGPPSTPQLALSTWLEVAE